MIGEQDNEKKKDWEVYICFMREVFETVNHINYPITYLTKS